MIDPKAVYDFWQYREVPEIKCALNPIIERLVHDLSMYQEQDLRRLQEGLKERTPEACYEALTIINSIIQAYSPE